MAKAKLKSLTMQGSLALVVFAVLVPVMSKTGLELDAETKQAVLLLIGAAITYGMRRAVGGLT